jgi:hypothetical protein
MNEPTITHEALEYSDALESEFSKKVMERSFSFVNQTDGVVEEAEVKRAFIEICLEMAKSLETV